MASQDGLEEVLECAILGMSDRDLVELSTRKIQLATGRGAGDLDDLLLHESSSRCVEDEEGQEMERNHEGPGAGPASEEILETSLAAELWRQEDFSFLVESRIQPAASPAAKTMGMTMNQTELSVD